MKPFSKWTIEDVEETFQLVVQKDHPILETWLTVEQPISTQELEELNRLKIRLQDSVWDWNEDELKGYFVLPLLDLIYFENSNYKSFLSRELSVEYNNETLAGIVDYVVAGGRRSPKHPYFFIQEYKKERGSSDDPLGQLMVAMVTAQLLNQDDHPLYGAYLIGRYWHFAILTGQEYSVHTGFNASDDELLQIFQALKQMKLIIERRF